MWVPLDEYNPTHILANLGNSNSDESGGSGGSFTPPKKLVSCILVTFKESCNSKIHHFSFINLLSVHATVLPLLDDGCHSTTPAIIKKISMQLIIQNACPTP